MAILVTGGTGYIGSHTIIELLNEGHDVVIVDNLSNSKIEVLQRIKQITSKDFKFHEVDILCKEALEEIFIENSIDAVIHFAGLKAVAESVVKPLFYYDNNITGTLVLCELMEKYNVKKMVFSSSATVYRASNSPLTEDSELGATNPYGNTKLMIEQILRDLCISNSSWGVTILRYFNPIGAHESGLVGEDSVGIPNNLMPYITQVAVGKREQLNIYGNDYNTYDGTGIRDYIHVVDLAKGHLRALNKIFDEEKVNVYNLGTGKGYSVLEVVHKFSKSTGIDIPYTFCNRRPGDVEVCYADSSKAFKELGWKSERDLEEMCKDAWRWQTLNPYGYTEK
ncbi:UDP-glucose 4-epimerase [Paenibacillus auburnensis]|uniref:UDP-glucose 4-epimerase n=1 Tax=Paenibacillus auburnensis TaxID=2905649 RepID=A0ABN8H269_9BACL|nr:UDP-glucose 4-epimerase GalE [Paenibacillus auburnensis]CAH1225202.1 UDP-glucose 4-epimerase [Paenibacillus auburnensis]